MLSSDVSRRHTRRNPQETQDEYKLIQSIGYGTYGDVHKGDSEVKEENLIDTNMSNDQKENYPSEKTKNSDKYLNSDNGNKTINHKSRSTNQSVNLKKYKCYLCVKDLKQKGNLQQHTLIHNDQRPFKCDKCEYSSRRKRNNLSEETNNSDKYINSNNGNKKINYESKSTNKSVNLKKYKCDLCKKDFKQKGDLVRHTLIHTGQRPFKCNKCKYRSTQKGNLKKHELIHSDKRPYKCNQCVYTCTQKSNLNKHKYIHSNKRPFQCNCVNTVVYKKVI